MIDIFTVGGTIDKVYFDALSEYQVGPSIIDMLLHDNNVRVARRVTQLMRKDSLDMTDRDRSLIRAAVLDSDASRIVITHGTDTMTTTGCALRGVVGKTIVLTGAMQPAAVRASDAAFNAGFALAVAQALSPGVYIAMNGMVFDPARVMKDRASSCFRNSDPDFKPHAASVESE